jgi:hypothetical protein
MWNSLEIAKFIAALATPVVVALIGFWLNAGLKKQESRFAQEKEERRRENVPHIELELDCEFHGVRGDKRLTTFLVSAANVGLIDHKFSSIMLVVRAIKDELFSYDDADKLRFDQQSRRASFPDKVVERDLVPKQWNFVFVEPGVTQQLSLTTLIPSECTYLQVRVAFDYKARWPHAEQAVFAVPQEGAARSQ